MRSDAAPVMTARRPVRGQQKIRPAAKERTASRDDSSEATDSDLMGPAGAREHDVARLLSMLSSHHGHHDSVMSNKDDGKLPLDSSVSVTPALPNRRPLSNIAASHTMNHAASQYFQQIVFGLCWFYKVVIRFYKVFILFFIILF